MTYLFGWLLCWVARWSYGCMSVYIYYVYVYINYKCISCNWICLYRKQDSLLSLCNKCYFMNFLSYFVSITFSAHPWKYCSISVIIIASLQFKCRRPYYWHSGSAWKCLGIRINCHLIPVLVLFHLFSLKRISVNFEFFSFRVWQSCLCLIVMWPKIRIKFHIKCDCWGEG
jgi:hypothetical protein